MYERERELAKRMEIHTSSLTSPSKRKKDNLSEEQTRKTKTCIYRQNIEPWKTLTPLLLILHTPSITPAPTLSTKIAPTMMKETYVRLLLRTYLYTESYAPPDDLLLDAEAAAPNALLLISEGSIVLGFKT